MVTVPPIAPAIEVVAVALSPAVTGSVKTSQKSAKKDAQFSMGERDLDRRMLKLLRRGEVEVEGETLRTHDEQVEAVKYDKRDGESADPDENGLAGHQPLHVARERKLATVKRLDAVVIDDQPPKENQRSNQRGVKKLRSPCGRRLIFLKIRFFFAHEFSRNADPGLIMLLTRKKSTYST